MKLGKSKGWKGEPIRHGLAAKGIKSGKHSRATIRMIDKARTTMIDSRESMQKLIKGTKVEMEEHDLSRKDANKIALDHLKVDPDYYSNGVRAAKSLNSHSELHFGKPFKDLSSNDKSIILKAMGVKK